MYSLLFVCECMQLLDPPPVFLFVCLFNFAFCECMHVFVVCYLATYSNFLECMAIGKTSYNRIPLKPIENTDNIYVTIHR